MIQRHFGRRKEINDPIITDRKLPFSHVYLSIVVKDWNILLEDFDSFAAKIFTNFLTEHPTYKNLFSGLGEIDEDSELEDNGLFMRHAYAIVNGISAALDSLTGEYEDDGEPLPIIGRAHKARGITIKMFQNLQDSILRSCFSLLRCDKRSRTAWKEVLHFIFENYLCSSMAIKK
ncbi:UNVERIFIED_CONTAM: hypothetical protein PYX00_006875 [Menopon gallinae]|uniref:Globin domain-containing protein n=1 Tax=Menopon gallinae TaxID=328185 RepID=A0AAW2HYH9_9NEOP